MAPLVVARKGLYNELAEWAARKGWFVLRVDGEPVGDRAPGRAWTASASTPSTCRWVRSRSARRRGRSCAPCSTRRWTWARAWCGWCGSPRGAWGAETPYSTQRACPGCGRAFPEPDPRLFSYNSKHGWCPACLGTGLAIPGFDGEQTGEEDQWLEPATERAGRLPRLPGRPAQPRGPGGALPGRSIADLSALDRDGDGRGVWPAWSWTRGRPPSPTTCSRRCGERLAFLAQVGLGYLTPGPRRPDPVRAARPSASGSPPSSAPTCKGSAMSWTSPASGSTRGTTACCWTPWTACRTKGNTVVVVEHDEETIRRAEHVIDLGPGAGVQGGRAGRPGDRRGPDRRPRPPSPGAILARARGHGLTETGRAARDRARATGSRSAGRACTTSRASTCACRCGGWCA